MSHIHSLSAQAAAAQQLEYLDRLRAAQLAREIAAVRRRSAPRAFHSLIEADAEEKRAPDEDGPDDERDPDSEPSDQAGRSGRYA